MPAAQTCVQLSLGEYTLQRKLVFIWCTSKAPEVRAPCFLFQNLADAHLDLGLSRNLWYHFGGPYTKDYSILGSILGSAYFGNLPFLN